jgi:hypothetical protein
VHQESLEVLTVVRIDRDPDAGVDEDLLALDRNGMRQSAEDAAGELCRILGAREAGMITVSSSPPRRATSAAIAA